jgi:hypothetical protein
MHATGKNTEALVVSSKQTSIEVNAEKTKYMIMSHDKVSRTESRHKDT